ncbi:MAG: DinB family protein [Planctomycetes bacterium]|nr:DinB family protein [Planctomycetota bacterium]
MEHFYAQIPDDIAALSNRDGIERYDAGAAVPGEAVADLTPEQLNSFPVPGTWSIQQIIVHLMDTDLIAAYRMKRIIAEDRPVLDLYGETDFAARLHYDKADAAMVCEVFRLNRQLTAEMLRQLPDDAFDRVAQHGEMGEMSLGRFLRLYIKHLDHHMRFIREKRELVTT